MAQASICTGGDEHTTLVALLAKQAEDGLPVDELARLDALLDQVDQLNSVKAHARYSGSDEMPKTSLVGVTIGKEQGCDQNRACI